MNTVALNIPQIIHELTLDFMHTQDFKFSSPEEYVMKYKEVYDKIMKAYSASPTFNKQ